MRLEDVRFVVTGAASGLGKASAMYLTANGGRVAAMDIDPEGLELLRRESNGAVRPYVVDLTKEEQVVQQVKQADADLGNLNGLINYAGIFRDGVLVRPGGIKLPLAQWKKVIDVDLTGTFLIVREVASAMLACATKDGVIILVSSISRHGNVGQASYSAAKAGIVADTRVWARELAPYGIRVGAISPGLFDTPILNAIDPARVKEYLSRIPLGRLGKPEELSHAVRFIIECDYFTGECLEVNGGFFFS
jgi:3-oxoacyl-[acyl-carrier protein] reductase